MVHQSVLLQFLCLFITWSFPLLFPFIIQASNLSPFLGSRSKATRVLHAISLDRQRDQGTKLHCLLVDLTYLHCLWRMGGDQFQSWSWYLRRDYWTWWRYGRTMETKWAAQAYLEWRVLRAWGLYRESKIEKAVFLDMVQMTQGMDYWGKVAVVEAVVILCISDAFLKLWSTPSRGPYFKAQTLLQYTTVRNYVT